MELTLMCQDREVAAFSLDLATERVLAVSPLAHASDAPLSVRLAGPDPADDLTRFLARRALSPWRRDLNQILEATQASSALELALRAHGLSLSDPYWYRAADDACTWQDINFRSNGWDPAFGEAVIAQDWEALATASCMVPDVTCAGFAPKAWIQTDDGPRILKSALGELGIDPVGEVLASRLAARILPEGASTPYDLVRRWERLFSSCPLITAPDEELVSVRALTKRGVHPDGSPNRPAVWDKDVQATCAEVLEAAGIPDPWPYIAQLTTCAALAIQTDLHLGNCCIIRNVRTGAVRTAPLFDFAFALAPP